LIPVVGASLAVLIPITFAVVAGGGWEQVLRIVGVFVVAQLLESFYLTPKILGRELSLSPFLVFAVVLVGGLAFGVVGALLAPPLAAIGALLWRTVGKSRSDSARRRSGR
jgi:predicted PurR-regulated permease PerM